MKGAAQASYAWMTLKHARLRGVDDAGVVRKRSTGLRPITVTLGERDPASSTPDPGAVAEERQSVAAIARAVEQLPASLREPLLASIRGKPTRAIADDLGYSESTAHRRINEAREHLRDELGPRAVDSQWVPFDKGTDPVLERAQRLSDQKLTPSPGLELGPGPAR